MWSTRLLLLHVFEVLRVYAIFSPPSVLTFRLNNLWCSKRNRRTGGGSVMCLLASLVGLAWVFSVLCEIWYPGFSSCVQIPVASAFSLGIHVDVLGREKAGATSTLLWLIVIGSRGPNDILTWHFVLTFLGRLVSFWWLATWSRHTCWKPHWQKCIQRCCCIQILILCWSWSQISCLPAHPSPLSLLSLLSFSTPTLSWVSHFSWRWALLSLLMALLPSPALLLVESNLVKFNLSSFALGGQTGDIMATCLLPSAMLLSSTTDYIICICLTQQRSFGWEDLFSLALRPPATFKTDWSSLVTGSMTSPLRLLHGLHFSVPLAVVNITLPSSLPVAFKTGETEGLLVAWSLTAFLDLLSLSETPLMSKSRNQLWLSVILNMAGSSSIGLLSRLCAVTAGLDMPYSGLSGS